MGLSSQLVCVFSCFAFAYFRVGFFMVLIENLFQEWPIKNTSECFWFNGLYVKMRMDFGVEHFCESMNLVLGF